MTSKSTVSAQDAHHRILCISFKVGFLDRAVLKYKDELNCIVGGRGSGKTTVLETIRHMLDQTIDKRGYQRAK